MLFYIDKGARLQWPCPLINSNSFIYQCGYAKRPIRLPIQVLCVSQLHILDLPYQNVPTVG